MEVARRLLSKLNLSDCELDWERIRNLPRITRQIAFNLLNSIQYISEQVPSIPPHEIEFCEQILRYFIIGSRFKVLVRVVTQVVRIVSQLSKLNKVQKLNLAMCTSVNDVLKDLQAGFKNHTESFIVDSWDLKRFNDYLLTLYTASVLYGRAKFIKEDAGQDLTRLGIANTYEKLNEYYFKIREPIVVFAIFFYIDSLSGDLNAFNYPKSRILDTIVYIVEKFENNPARGPYFERLIFEATKNPAFQNQFVSELPFVKLVLNEENSRLRREKKTMPEWCKTTEFAVNHVVPKHSCTAEFF